MKQWFLRNKVILAGIVLAVLMPVYGLIQTGTTDARILIVSAAIALTGILAKDLRGQWATVFGILGTVLMTVAAQIQTGKEITWWQVAIQLIILYLTAIAPPPKTIGYEKSFTIQTAKEEGREITQILKDETTTHSN